MRNGIALDADEHVARLLRSVRELFGPEPTVDLDLRVADVARQQDIGRVRIIAVPRPSGSVTVEVEAAPLGQLLESAPCVLAPVTLAGGLGPHKWCDRRLLGELERVAGAVPLLVDLDGHVLEAAHANIFAVEGKTLVTPRLDGRLLPGVVRGRLLVAASDAGLDVREENVTLERLAAADELLLTSSLRGVHAARLVGGAPPARFELGARLRRALR